MHFPHTSPILQAGRVGWYGTTDVTEYLGWFITHAIRTSMISPMFMVGTVQAVSEQCEGLVGCKIQCEQLQQ